ncbi:MAG: hypothetical protein ACE5GC_09440 [Acidimicrobiia bacterium]
MLAGALALAPTLTFAGDLPPGGSFSDDNGNVHEGSIEAIAAEAITRGCNPPANDLYCPSGTVTRGQMAAFLVRALGLTDNGVGNLFIDDDDSIFETDIDKLGTAAITRGCNPPVNDQFCPDGNVTRGQMAAFLVRAFGYSDNGGGNLFIDDNDSIFETDIDKLGTAGVTRGCNPPTNDRYCPNALVQRDQMASFLTRALGLTPMVPPPPLGPGDFVPFTVQGTGDDVPSLVVPGDNLAVLRFTYSGPSNFIVWALDDTFGKIDLLVNEIGAYSGGRPVNLHDFSWDIAVTFLDVTASAPWTIDVEPLSDARLLTTTISGSTDDVIRVSKGGIASFSFTGPSNFIVWARSIDGQLDLLVNEIGATTGNQVIPAWAEYLDIVGIGTWTITFA